MLAKGSLKIFNLWGKGLQSFYQYMVEIPFLQYLNTNVQRKPIGADRLNNINAKNQREELGRYPEILTYINMYQSNTSISTKWLLHTILEDLAEIGGLKVFVFAIAAISVKIFTHKIHQVKMFMQFINISKILHSKKYGQSLTDEHVAKLTKF